MGEKWKWYVDSTKINKWSRKYFHKVGDRTLEEKSNECYNTLLTAFYHSTYDFVFFQVLALDIMINFVSIYRIVLAKIENTVSLFQHKSVEIEGQMAFHSSVQAAVSQISFQKAKPSPRPITIFVRCWLVCLHHYHCGSRVSTTAGRNLSFENGLERVEKVRPCGGRWVGQLCSQTLQCGGVRLILPDVMAGSWGKLWPLGAGNDCRPPW